MGLGPASSSQDGDAGERLMYNNCESSMMVDWKMWCLDACVYGVDVH